VVRSRGVNIRLATPAELPLAIAIDDDATELYTTVGVGIGVKLPQAFVEAEQLRWLRCAEAGSLWLALVNGTPAGFAAVEVLDGTPHLEQLSVLRAFGRRGIGTALLQTALAHARRRLTLTTYAHVAWNAPWYARQGFRVLTQAEQSPALRERMREEQAALPEPQHRVAMLHSDSR
jgi:GNAT superfamily N-acetyltransferase